VLFFQVIRDNKSLTWRSTEGFRREGDLLSHLLALNLIVARKTRTKDEVTGPGLPVSYPDQNGLVSEDCIIADKNL